MEYKFVTITAQNTIVDLATHIQRETSSYARDGYELHQTDTVYNGSSYSTILTFKKP